MKKLLTILFSILLTANFLSCGGGGSTSTDISGKTKVTISLGETKTVSSSFLKSTSSIPAAIASIRFTISAPDMATIEREIVVSGRTSISETFEVPTGSNRHFLVEALDVDENVLFQGSTYTDVTGVSVNLTIAMISVEDIAPVFSGLTGIDSVTATSMVLSWLPATDNVTPSERIQYLIYISSTPGDQDFTNPDFVTSIGAVSHTITNLDADTTYYIVVRAMDERGNIDDNNMEISDRTLVGAVLLGKVTLDDVGLAGVTVTLTGSTSNSVTTNSNGDYAFTGLDNGSYTITPSMTGYAFTPANISVTLNDGASAHGLDFTATIPGSALVEW